MFLVFLVYSDGAYQRGEGECHRFQGIKTKKFMGHPKRGAINCVISVLFSDF